MSSTTLPSPVTTEALPQGYATPAINQSGSTQPRRSYRQASRPNRTVISTSTRPAGYPRQKVANEDPGLFGPVGYDNLD